MFKDYNTREEMEKLVDRYIKRLHVICAGARMSGDIKDDGEFWEIVENANRKYREKYKNYSENDFAMEMLVEVLSGMAELSRDKEDLDEHFN